MSQVLSSRRYAHRGGFSLLELIVAISIFVVVMGATLPFAGGYFSTSVLQTSEQDVLQVLRRAQHRAVSGQRDSAWGVNFSGNTYTLYAGDSYALRNIAFDRQYSIDGAYQFSGVPEITFQKVTGKANPAGAVSLYHSEAGSFTITVTPFGSISLQ